MVFNIPPPNKWSIPLCWRLVGSNLRWNIHSSDHFIRYTYTVACSWTFLISKSCGSNSIHKRMQTWSIDAVIVQKKLHKGEEMCSKWLWPWNDCQMGWFDYLRNCWSPFSCTMVYTFIHKNIQWASVLWAKMHCLWEVRGEWPDWFKLTGRRQQL